MGEINLRLQQSSTCVCRKDRSMFAADASQRLQQTQKMASGYAVVT